MRLMNGQRRLWFSTSVSFLVAATFVLMLLIMITNGTELSAEDTWPFLSSSPTKSIMKNDLLRCSVDLNSTSGGMFFIMHKLKCILVSLISFAMMFALTVYLVLLSLRFKGYHKKSGVRRCRVSSCL